MYDCQYYRENEFILALNESIVFVLDIKFCLSLFDWRTNAFKVQFNVNDR